MLLDNTPIEEYMIKGRKVYVKRDDLFGQGDAPPLAKLRGAYIYLKKIVEQNPGKPIGVFDTTISKAGQGIAYLCKEYGAECWCGFPLLKGTEPATSKIIARDVLGAKLFPLKAGRTAPVYYGFARTVKEEGGIMLPLGLTCKETVNEMSRVSVSTLQSLYSKLVDIKTIVLVTGTGTIATGISLGSNIWDPKIKVYGISCGMSITEQWKRIRQMAYPDVICNLELVEPEYGYYDKLDIRGCPFPTSPYYDMKAWSWLCSNIDKLSGDSHNGILFWNIGA